MIQSQIRRRIRCWEVVAQIARTAAVDSILLVSYEGIESSHALVELAGAVLEVNPVSPPQVWVLLKWVLKKRAP